MNGAAGFWIGFFFLLAVESFCNTWKIIKGKNPSKQKFFLWRIFEEITPDENKVQKKIAKKESDEKRLYKIIVFGSINLGYIGLILSTIKLYNLHIISLIWSLWFVGILFWLIGSYAFFKCFECKKEL